MATDKNKNNKLDANSEDDTTAELAIVQLDSDRIGEEAEADANTYAFDESDSDGQSESVASLRSSIRSRDKHIGKLQFDAEQLRARWTGLEKEITAREELTRILQQDLRDAHKERTAKNKLLQKNERKIESLLSSLEKFEHLSAASADNASPDIEQTGAGKIGAQNESSGTLQQQLEKERVTVSELTAYIDGRKQDWSQLRRDVETYNASLDSKDDELTRLAAEVADKEKSQLISDNEIERLQKRLKKERTTTKQLGRKNRALTLDIDTYQGNDQFNVEQRLAEQSGRLVSNEDEIKELKAQIVRSERYADGLRENLGNLDILSTESENKRQQLDGSLQQTTEQVRELREQLDAERLLNTDLQTVNVALKKDFEKEVNLIRFELSTAQDTLGDYASVNEELASNLIDNTHFRQALEEQLDATEGKHVLESSRLKKRVSQLEKQLEDNERKVGNKDAAISALLAELASKNQAIESMGDIGSVIHEIDDKMSERIEDRNGQERDRPTRLLIGMIDGQELQFPLFKERLTIGRTRQNDIQIKAQYISRRHAVILSDDEGTRIIDWGSKNGISVNDTRVSEQQLRSGDNVTIGTANFVFEERQKR